MNPYDSYANAGMMGTDQEVEASALSKAASLLKDCQQDWDAPERPRRLAEALELNQKLWSIFQTSLAADDHPMPIGLRTDILRLASFIDKRIFEVMAQPAVDKLTAIIQINLNLAAGLRDGARRNTDFAPAISSAFGEQDSSQGSREDPVWA